MISVVAFANALYSASVLDLETVACFLAHHEIKLGPKNTANPPVERLSSNQPAQSESEKALRSVDDDLLKLRPILRAFLTYLTILLAAVKWTVVGAWRNWQTLLTANDISGLVRVRYWSTPTRLLYLVLSSWLKACPSVRDNFSELDNGVGEGLQPCRPAFLTRSVAYFSWDKWSPPSCFFTSIPKK